jgi:hypothetical protein
MESWGDLANLALLAMLPFQALIPSETQRGAREVPEANSFCVLG